MRILDKKKPGRLLRANYDSLLAKFFNLNFFLEVAILEEWGNERVGYPKFVPHLTITVKAPFKSINCVKDKNYLTQEYVSNGKSLNAVAKSLGCSRHAVVKNLLNFGIELRKDGLSPLSKSQLAYGERLFKGKLVPHLGERKVILQMAELRRQGLSYEKIAKWINENHIPTKNRVGKWDRRTIYEILKRIGPSV
jgi:biotin operon repressor